MIFDVQDPDATQTAKPIVARPSEPKNRWWGKPSPWLWGLLILLAIAVTQVPRIAQTFAVRGSKPSPAASTAAPVLSGTVYTQAMVADKNFIGADLRGARLAHLDLRGKDFRYADAAGAVFSGSLLNGADFSRADLRGADFSSTCLQGSILTGAQLSGANFTAADVAGVTVKPTAVFNAIGWASIPASLGCSQS